MNTSTLSMSAPKFVFNWYILEISILNNFAFSRHALALLHEVDRGGSGELNTTNFWGDYQISVISPESSMMPTTGESDDQTTAPEPEPGI